MKYTVASRHGENLHDGRVVAPGAVVDIELDSDNHDHYQRMIDEGVLVPFVEESNDEVKEGE